MFIRARFSVVEVAADDLRHTHVLAQSPPGVGVELLRRQADADFGRRVLVVERRPAGGPFHATSSSGSSAFGSSPIAASFRAMSIATIPSMRPRLFFFCG